MKRLIALVLSLLLLVGVMPVAYAQEIISEVSTLAELQEAIAQAEDGDTIRLTQTIIISEPVMLGQSGKKITLTGDPATYLQIEGFWSDSSYTWLNDLHIDGNGAFAGSKIVVNAYGTVYFSGVSAEHCHTDTCGGAIRVEQGTAIWHFPQP